MKKMFMLMLPFFSVCVLYLLADSTFYWPQPRPNETETDPFIQPVETDKEKEREPIEEKSFNEQPTDYLDSIDSSLPASTTKSSLFQDDSFEDHPLQEEPLDTHNLQEKPLQEEPIPDNPLPDNPV
jgi:cytoskeletal protein RodZ